MFPHAPADSSALILNNLKASAPVEIRGSERRLMHAGHMYRPQTLPTTGACSTTSLTVSARFGHGVFAPADNTMLTLLALRHFTTSGVLSLPPLHAPLFQQRMEQIPRASLTCASLSGLPIFPLAVSIFGIFGGHTPLRADAAHGCRFECVIDRLLTKTTLPCSHAVYSFDDTSGDTSLSNFNINNAPSYLYSVLNDIRSINNVLRIHILPWSPVRLQAQRVWA